MRADHGARWIRYVLISSQYKEANRLITDAETTLEEVTVDSLSFKSKNEFGTRWAMLRQSCQCWASVILRRLAMIQLLGIAAERPVLRAAASIESP